jgi:hypothetical protein
MDGDALSIREALDAGVPVVASDVVERPFGVATFSADNAVDLARVVEETLAQRAPVTVRAAPPARTSSDGENFLAALIKIYREQIELARTTL